MWPFFVRNKAPDGGNAVLAEGERKAIKTSDSGFGSMEGVRAVCDRIAQQFKSRFEGQQASRRHADDAMVAGCSAALHVTHRGSAAPAAAVVTGHTAPLTASAGVEATKRLDDVATGDGAGAAEFEGEDLWDLSAVAAAAAGKGWSDTHCCALLDHGVTRTVPAKEKTVRWAQERSSSSLYDLVLESGGQRTLSLLIPHVDASEALRPGDPATRSVDVQQQRRDFKYAYDVVTVPKRPRCTSCGASSSTSFLTGDLPARVSGIFEESSKTWKCQVHGSVDQNIDGAVASAGEVDSRGAEADPADAEGRLVPVPRVTEFKDLALDAALLENLQLLGFRIPSPVQCALVPRALDGKNLIVQAKSGTGKTLAFALYLLHALTQRFKQRLAQLAASSHYPRPETVSQGAATAEVAEGQRQHGGTARHARATEKDQCLQKPASSFDYPSSSAAADADCIAMALVVTPTRELTIQVANEISRLGWRMRQPPLRHACFFGGRPLSVCHQQLAQQPHVLISTPGRLLSLLRSKATRKAVAAWPCRCARAVDSHVVESSQSRCESSVEEPKSRSDRHNSSATPRGSACDSSSNSEQDNEISTSEDKRDTKTSQGLQSHNIEEFCKKRAAPSARCGGRLSLSRCLRQRLCIMVLDEADMLLDHFFRLQTKKLLSTILHPRLQLLATSATFPPPYVTFLEELCRSLDAEKQRGLCQHTALRDLPLRNTKNCGTDRGQRIREDAADRAATVSLDTSAVVAAFIRDHASAAASDFRSAAVDAYLNNFTERRASKSVLQAEVTERPAQPSSSGTVPKAEAAYFCGAGRWLDADKSSARPVTSKAAVQTVDSLASELMPRIEEKPRVFERVMLCSSLVVHAADSSCTSCEGMVSQSDRRPTRGGLRIATSSFGKTCARVRGTFAASQKADANTAVCELSECSGFEEDGHLGCCLKQLNDSVTEAVREAAVLPLTEELPEKQAMMDVQTHLENSARAEKKGSFVTNFVRKVRVDAGFTAESTPGEAAVDGVSALDADGSHLEAANDLHFTEMRPKPSAVMGTCIPRPTARCKFQRQSLKPAEDEKTTVLQKPAGSTVNVAVPAVDRNYQSGGTPGESPLHARRKPKTESPSLVGIHHVIMTVEDEPSLMRQLGAKVRALQHIFSNLIFRQAMVFCNQAEAGAQIAACLIQLGVPTLYTSSKLTQEHRVRNLLALKRINCRVFVCSDVMSRGIDAAAVDLVVNLDVPRDKDIFLHRSGRAGRFGGNGVCVCIASKDEQPFFEYLAAALKLPVFPSLESLSRLQRERGLLRDGTGRGVVGDERQENVFHRGSYSEAGSQNIGDNEARQGTCAEFRQRLGFVGECVVEDRNSERVHARNQVPLLGPDTSTSAAEIRAAAGMPDSEANQAVIRLDCAGDASLNAGMRMSDTDPTDYEQRNVLSASGRIRLDTCGGDHPSDRSMYLGASVPASLMVQARSRRERDGVSECQSVQLNAKNTSIDSLHLRSGVYGYYSAECVAVDKIDRDDTRRGAQLQEGIDKAKSTDSQIPVERESSAVRVRSPIVDLNVALSNSLSRCLDASGVAQRDSEGVEWSPNFWGEDSVLLQPYEHLHQWGGQAGALLSSDTSVLSSVAAAALSAHDRPSCDNLACTSASLVVSDAACGVADADFEHLIPPKPPLLSVLLATPLCNELQKTERRISDVGEWSKSVLIVTFRGSLIERKSRHSLLNIAKANRRHAENVFEHSSSRMQLHLASTLR